MSSVDGFRAGTPDTPITGVATTFTPSLDVLRRAVAARRNLIVSRETPFWNRKPAAAGMAQNPTFIFKQEFIAKNNLVIWQFRDNWDGQQRGLIRALEWHKHRSIGETFFVLPPASLEALAKSIQSRLKIHALRAIGDPTLEVSKVALSHGMITVAEMRKLLEEPDVDALAIGEPVEWEASPYFMDAIASGQKKGLLVLGQQASEEPGSAEMATWLKPVVPEVPVEWMPSGEPFTPGRWS